MVAKTPVAGKVADSVPAMATAIIPAVTTAISNEVPPNPRVVLGKIVAVYGVGGAIKIASFTAAPRDIFAYPSLVDQHGKEWNLKPLRQSGKALLATVAGVANRSDAEKLVGLELAISRQQLPPPEDEEEFYYADLIGCTALNLDGESCGKVLAVQDFGGGELLEIGSKGKSDWIPFTKAAVPTVDLSQRRIVIAPIDWVEGENSRPNDI